MKLNKKKKGFTIVELVIVIGVIGILAGILIPTFVNVQAKAEEAALKSNLVNAYSAYIADATGDNAIDENKAITDPAENTTYYIVPLSQEAVVLKDAKGAYEFDGEWKSLEGFNDANKTIVYTISGSTKEYSTKVAKYGGFEVYAKGTRPAF